MGETPAALGWDCRRPIAPSGASEGGHYLVGPLFPFAHIVPPPIERRAAAVPDAEQEAHALAFDRVFGQTAAVAADRCIPI